MNSTELSNQNVGSTLFALLLEKSEAFASDRFQATLDSMSGFITIKDRVSLLKEFGTIRLSIGRRTGQTTASTEFITKRYNGCRVIYFSPKHSLLKDNPFESCSWHTAECVNPTGIRAIFIDPGPHAGPVARDAIYELAAQAMSTPDGAYVPVLLYFVGT